MKTASSDRSFNSGKFDGINAGSMRNPPHVSWRRDKTNKIMHFDTMYVKGYVDGYRESTGIDLSHQFNAMCTR